MEQVAVIILFYNIRLCLKCALPLKRPREKGMAVRNEVETKIGGEANACGNKDFKMFMGFSSLKMSLSGLHQKWPPTLTSTHKFTK